MLVSVSNKPTLRAPETIGEHSKIYSSGSEGNLNRFIEAGHDLLAQARSIILGRDDRDIQFNTRKLPWRTICALEIISVGGVQHGTGWFAGPNTIVTCGHCVYSNDLSGWAEKIVATPASSSRGNPFGNVSSTHFFCTESWKTEGNIVLDIGAIHLEEPMGEKLGWFGYDVVGVESENKIANVSGYSEYDGAYDKLLTHQGPIEKYFDGRLFYPIDTDVGQSGAPVWLKQNTESPIPLALGVHAYNTDKTPAELGIEANSAIALTSEVVDLIYRWTTVS